MSTRDSPGGKGGRCVRLTTLVVPNVKKSGALTYPEPLGPPRRPVVGETFTFYLNFKMIILIQDLYWNSKQSIPLTSKMDLYEGNVLKQI